MSKAKPEPDIGVELRDRFFAKWGRGEPAPAYADHHQRDLETVQWALGIKPRKAKT